MLITFKTRARHPDITMFGDVALQFLRFMERGETIPSAMGPEDIPVALKRLRAALKESTQTESSEQPEDDDEEAVPISTRAGPLIELLEAAARENVAVMWDEY